MTTNGIGTLSERSLHASIKDWYAKSGDEIEAQVDGFFIDILRDDLLVEIQTRHLYAMRRKLVKLLGKGHNILVLHPIPIQKWICKVTLDGEQISRRRSPKRGRYLDIFRELVRMADLMVKPGLSIGVLLTEQEEIWRDDGQGSWRRRGWSLIDQRLIGVRDQQIFKTPTDFKKLLPTELPVRFTTRDLARILGCQPALAGKIAYSFYKMAVFERVGRQGRAYVYQTLEDG